MGRARIAGARDLHLVVASSRTWPPGYRRLARLTRILAMQINMRDPESIAAWYEVFPARHGPQLAALRALRPAFAPAIDAAGQLLRARRLAAAVGQPCARR